MSKRERFASSHRDVSGSFFRADTIGLPPRCRPSLRWGSSLCAPPRLRCGVVPPPAPRAFPARTLTCRGGHGTERLLPGVALHFHEGRIASAALGPASEPQGIPSVDARADVSLAAWPGSMTRRCAPTAHIGDRTVEDFMRQSAWLLCRNGSRLNRCSVVVHRPTEVQRPTQAMVAKKCSIAAR